MANIIQQFKNAGGDNIYPVAYAQGGMKMDLLWTNPSPTSRFGASTLSIDTTDYSLLLIEYLWTNGGTDVAGVGLVTDKDRYIYHGFTAMGGSITRKILCNGTQVIFGDGYNGGSVANNVAIPYKIYGIKMSYIVPTSVHGLQYVEV